MKLKGKKIACFVAIPMHTRFFIPIMEQIRGQGGDASFIVPLSEFPFEIAALRKKLPFKYFSDYMTAEVKQKIKRATIELMDEWNRTCYKWDGFRRWPLFKQSWFFEGILEEYFCMEKFIEVERPDMFLVNHECHRWGKIIGYLANEKSIPLVTFQEGDYHTPQMGHSVHTEYSTVDLLWGERTIRYLKQYKNSPDKMIPIGNTHIEGAIKEHTSQEMRASTKKELNIPPDKKVVLFLLDISYAGVERKDDWKMILQGLDGLGDDVVCVFKWHPCAYLSTFEAVQKVFKKLYPSAILLYTYEPYKLIGIADYCVTLGRTSLAVEALAFGKPLFSCPAANEVDDPYISMGVSQTIFPPGNWSGLIDTMKNGVPATIQAGVDEYVEDYFYRLDGRSIERAIDVMEYVFDVWEDAHEAKSIEKKEYVPGRVSFIIPTGHNTEAFLATLTSLSQNVKHPDWEVVVVVNSDDMSGVLSGILGDIKIVEHRSNALAALYNKGADASSGEFLVFMRPGIVYFKDEGLVEGMKENIMGIPLKNADMTPYCFGIGYDFNATPYLITDASKKPNAVGGGFIAMRRGIFESVGGFDEEIANHLTEPDICLHARGKGISVQYADKSLGFNYRETFSGDDTPDETWKHRARFYTKWIGKLPKDEDFLSFAKDLLKV